MTLKLILKRDSTKALEAQIHELDKQKTIGEERIENALEKFKQQERLLAEKTELADTLKEENILLRAENKSLQEKLSSQKEELEKIQQKFAIEFENIANRIVKQNTSEFSETNKKKLNEVLNPLKEKLGEFELKVQSTYEKGLKERSTLAEQIKNLAELNKQMHTDAQNLTNALKETAKHKAIGESSNWKKS